MAEHNKIGQIGENLVKTFLMKHDFRILGENYRTKFGEIDIIAQKDKKVHFVEVKTVKVRNVDKVGNLAVRPEDNLTERKYAHLAISAEGFLKNKGISQETLWQMDLACVYLDTETKQGRVVLMENILKE
jgi:putative endonuclease